MTKIDIFSGFLGAGKTTLIKKLIREAFAGEKVVLIENEFGEIGIDGGFLQDAGIQITEMNSGCICCSLVGDFSKALKKVQEEYHPERILIEPSGVGKLSDVIRAVERAELEDASINSFTTVVDAKKCKMYLKNFGEFFGDQIDHAACVALSHTDSVSEEKLAEVTALIKAHNPACTVIATNWNDVDGKQILSAMEHTSTLADELKHLEKETRHAHGEECDDPECSCHHHGEHDHHDHHHGEHEHCHDEEHEHDDEEHEHHCCHHDEEHDEEHEHHCCHHDEDEHEHEEHEHHHDGECDDPECSCHHEHHHHHHADEIFTSFGRETTGAYTKEQIEKALELLADEETYGVVLRAKGIVKGENEWIHFDYVPGEPDVRYGCADVIGKLCVIGCKLNEEALSKLFAL